MKRTLFAVALALVSTVGAFAQVIAGPGGAWYQGTVPEYIQFTNVQLNIDLGDLGGPLYSGFYTSPSSIVEVDANVFLQANVLNGGNVTEAKGGKTLPTLFVTQVMGEGNLNGTSFSSPGSYAGGLTTNPGDSWYVLFNPGAGNGVKTNVMITRSGLKDYAGAYATNTILNWVKW